MGFAEVFLIGVGLSMDAFAVALCKGLSMRRLDARRTVVIALFFGAFQLGMPLLGWALGKQFESSITAIDHWIAFGLLAVIGGKMLWEAFREEDKPDACPVESPDRLDLKELTLLAVATSIDALAVGITFAFLQVDIVPSVSVIGITTFVLSAAGVAIGHSFGARFEKPATIVGGIVLIGIGVKTLLEHLGVLAG